MMRHTHALDPGGRNRQALAELRGADRRTQTAIGLYRFREHIAVGGDGLDVQMAGDRAAPADRELAGVIPQ